MICKFLHVIVHMLIHTYMHTHTHTHTHTSPLSFPPLIQAKVTVTVHEDLSILGTVPGLVTVRNQSSTHFNLKLLTRGIGRLRIRIKAVVRGKKYSDTVEKNLFVKVRTCMCIFCDCYWISWEYRTYTQYMYVPSNFTNTYVCMYM